MSRYWTAHSDRDFEGDNSPEPVECAAACPVTGEPCDCKDFCGYAAHEQEGV
jgi:hypothetical protein